MRCDLSPQARLGTERTQEPLISYLCSCASSFSSSFFDRCPDRDHHSRGDRASPDSRTRASPRGPALRARRGPRHLARAVSDSPPRHRRSGAATASPARSTAAGQAVRARHADPPLLAAPVCLAARAHRADRLRRACLLVLAYPAGRVCLVVLACLEVPACRARHPRRAVRDGPAGRDVPACRAVLVVLAEGPKYPPRATPFIFEMTFLSRGSRRAAIGAPPFLGTDQHQSTASPRLSRMRLRRCSRADDEPPACTT